MNERLGDEMSKPNRRGNWVGDARIGNAVAGRGEEGVFGEMEMEMERKSGR